MGVISEGEKLEGNIKETLKGAVVWEYYQRDYCWSIYSTICTLYHNFLILNPTHTVRQISSYIASNTTTVRSTTLSIETHIDSYMYTSPPHLPPFGFYFISTETATCSLHQESADVISSPPQIHPHHTLQMSTA